MTTRTQLERLTFLGGGNMGRALIGGLLQQGIRPEAIAVGESFEPARAALTKDFGITIFRHVLPNTLAPIFVAALEGWAGGGIPVVRTMPNRPALVGAGATGLFAPATVSVTDRARAESIMQATGEVVWVKDEAHIDAVTALSGSGPAYFFLLAELMAQAGADLGLEPETARRLAVATLHGAGLLARSGDGDLARLRAEVTSKGGTTEAALKVMQAADLRGIVGRAMDAAARRGGELAAQFGDKK